MVSRKDARSRSTHWCVYFPRNKQARKWKGILRGVVESGRAGALFRDVSNLKVELVWPQEVTFKSAARLIDLAQARDSSFEILGGAPKSR